MAKKAFIYCLLLIATLNKADGQLSNRIHEQLRFSYITIDDGLANNRVRGLGYDKNGFVWIGTRLGISRFDGYDVVSYTQYLADDTIFNFEETREILTDHQGTVWAVGVYGICFFDWAKNMFVEFSHPELDININNTFGLAQDSKGNIWFGTRQGLLRYNPQSKEVYLYKHDAENPKSLPRGNLNKILVTRNDHVWYCFERDGVGFHDPETGGFNRFLPNNNPNSLAESRTESLFEDSKGNVWIGHNNNGLSRYSYITKDFTRLYPEEGSKEAGRVRGIVEDKRGNLWFGTQGGLYLYNQKNQTFRLYASAEHPISTLSHNSIQTMIIDDQEGLWLGTFAGGVSYTNLNSSGIVWYQYSNIRSEYYLNDKSVYSLTFDHDNNIWVGTENGGLNFLDRETGKFQYFTENLSTNNAPRSNNIKDIYVDGDGLVWFGTYKGGMSYYDPSNKSFKHYQRRDDYPQGIKEETIFIIHPDATDPDLLWVGTTNRIYVFDKKEEKFTHISPESKSYKNVPKISRAYDVCFVGNNKLAFAVDDFIMIVDCLNKEIQTIAKVGDVEVDESNFVFTDKQGFLWAGINNNALVRCDLKTGNNVYIDVNNGLPDAEILEGTCDNAGNVWLSSNRGIWKIEGIINDQKNFTVVQYNKSDNVQSMEFLYHSQAKSNDGEILFGGINGFNSFYPENVKPNEYLPKVFPTKLSVVGKEVEVGQKVFGKVLLKKPIMETKQLALNHKMKLFRIDFTGIHYVAPKNNKFKYILEGFDDDWHHVGANMRSATYSNIPRGTYRFMVDATNNNGMWSGNPYVLEMKVTPPFWKTIWFYSILAIMLTIAIILVVKWRERQLHHDKQMLEEQLKKGQEEINRGKMEVAKQSEELRQRDIAEQEQRWIQTGVVQLGEVITNNKNDLKELCKKFLGSLVQYLDAQQGAVFILNDDNGSYKFLELHHGYALNKTQLSKKKIEIGEGLVGVCFKDNETMVVNELPKGYTQVGTGLGDVVPVQLLLTPLKVDEMVLGVLEISVISKLEDFKIKFVEKICEMFSSNIFTSRTNKKMQDMLLNSQQQAEEMQSKEEEMRQSMEELQATQEELQRKQDQIRQIADELVHEEIGLNDFIEKIKKI
jgi:ligand-binding sensor domain-containing protein/septum formation inhibitor MinC